MTASSASRSALRRPPFWPVGLPWTLHLPPGGLFANLQRAAEARPDHLAIAFYGGELSYRQLLDRVLRLAGYLVEVCGVRKGDRVLLDMQNSPQFVIGYYGVLAAGGVVVPVNPMNLAAELEFIRADSGAQVALVGSELADRFSGLSPGLKHVIVARYAEEIPEPCPYQLPDVVRTSRIAAALPPGFTAWTDAIAAPRIARPVTARDDDLCVMPYTSGTTGKPKACMHTQRSTQFTAVAQALWYGFDDDSVVTAFMPLFHVAAMQASMNAGIHAGATLVLMARWDKTLIPPLFERYRVTFWNAAPTMIIDVLSSPEFDDRCFATLRTLTGGGATMPAAVAEALERRFGLTYVEGYGMTETIAPTHLNPPRRAKPQCLGIPIFETESRVVDPETLAQRPVGELGEILVSGPQVMRGYWNRPDADAECFVVLDGRRFLRTGDLGYRDAEGYYFAVDRLKRMINVSGFKVWPAECEASFHAHPAIQECCVISAPDPYRGETVKAVIVLKPEFRGRIDAAAIAGWARDRMAGYKVPRLIEIVEALPRSASNKIDWRRLQDREWAVARTAP